MNEQDKDEYSCLCVACHRRINYPLCIPCIEETEREVQEWLMQQKRKPPEMELLQTGVKVSQGRPGCQGHI